MKIIVNNPIYQQQAIELSDKTGFLIKNCRDLTDFCLIFDEKPQLFAPKCLNLSPLSVDFNSTAVLHRFRFDKSYAQNLAKAIGIKPNYKPEVIDATAGLANDALAIACFGCQVQMIERNLIVASLLESALRIGSDNIKLNEIITKNLQLIVGDANNILPTLKPLPKVIYLDPMFPKNIKRRLPNRTMQYFREIIGQDTDFNELFEYCLQCNFSRIVVKRSTKDDFIGSKKPNHQVFGKTTRYDVYLPAL